MILYLDPRKVPLPSEEHPKQDISISFTSSRSKTDSIISNSTLLCASSKGLISWRIVSRQDGSDSSTRFRSVAEQEQSSGSTKHNQGEMSPFTSPEFGCPVCGLYTVGAILRSILQIDFHKQAHHYPDRTMFWRVSTLLVVKRPKCLGIALVHQLRGQYLVGILYSRSNNTCLNILHDVTCDCKK